MLVQPPPSLEATQSRQSWFQTTRWHAPSSCAHSSTPEPTPSQTNYSFLIDDEYYNDDHLIISIIIVGGITSSLIKHVVVGNALSYNGLHDNGVLVGNALSYHL